MPITPKRSARRVVARLTRARGSFKEDIIQAFYDGIRHKPETTFGNVNADVLADKDPQLQARQLLQCDPRLGVAGVNRTPWRTSVAYC